MKARAIVVAIVVSVAFVSGMTWASVAPAATFHSEAPHTTITGNQTTKLELAFDSGGPGTLHCGKSNFTATVEGTPFGGFTATPTQSECTLTRGGGNISVTTSFNGCDYRFTAAGSFEIQCPVGKSIEISGTGCTVKIPVQSVNGLSYANTGEGEKREIDITFNLSGLAYSYSGGTCGSGSETSNGTLKGSMTALGHCPNSNPAGIWFEGKGESGCKTPSAFRSEVPNSTITGSQTTKLELAFDSTGPGTLHCGKSTFTAKPIGTSFGGFTATPAQSECTLTRSGGNISVTTNFNGCDYRFTASGSFEIECPAGNSIEISGADCKVTIPAQSVNGLTYANTGSGKSRDIDITFNLSGLLYSYSEPTCGSGTETGNGTLKGAMTASGECPDESQIGIWFEGNEETGTCPPQTFRSETSEAAITGSQTTTLEFAFDAGGGPGTLHCKNSSFTATPKATSFESFTATPAQSECTLTRSGGNISVTTNFNGCDYHFAAAGSFEVKCPAGKSIEISGTNCTVTIPAQTLNGLGYTNTGSGKSRDFDISFNLSNLVYSYSGATCGSGSGTSNGTLKGAMTAVGECPDGSSAGIWFEGSNESSSCPSPTGFNSESSDTTITAAQTTTLVFTIDPGTVSCKTSTFSATASGTSFESITATPVQGECTLATIFGPITFTPNLNGCDYVLNFAGSFQIKCPEGKSISMTGPGCTWTIPAQSLASGITYTNTGSGSSRDLDISFSLSGISYSYTGFMCGSGPGTTNGTLNGTMTASGESGSSPVGIWRQ